MLEADDILDKARAHALYVALVPMWGQEYAKAFKADADKARAFGRWIGRRYRSHRHVVWIVSGEYAGINNFRLPISAEQKAVLNAAAEGLRDGHGGTQLMTIHPGGSQSSSRDFHDAAWLDLNMLQSGHFIDASAYSIFLYKQITPMQWAMRELRCGEGEGICVADLNGDGKPDIVIGGTWFENSGDLLKGPWTEHLFTTEWNYPHSKVAIGDLNGDGRLDILLAPAELQGGTHRHAWNEAPADPKAGNWKQHIIEEPVETVIHALAIADFNRDKRLDLVAARMHQGNSPQEVVVYLNAGDGLTWKRRVIATTGSHDVVTADIDGDGRPDVLGANHGGPFQPVELWLNRPAVRAPAHGPLRALPANPRYFTDDGQRAVYLILFRPFTRHKKNLRDFPGYRPGGNV